jgi:hypothetical protein
MMVDPDLLMNNDTYCGQVRHWLVTNLSSTPSGTLSHHAAAERSPYVRPAPLPNYLYSRPHRYVFILARGSSKVEIRPEDLREMQKEWVAAVKGRQGEMQDLKDRWGFNAQRLCEEKGLEVLAVTFMRVGGTVESGLANAVMMGQAVVDKVCCWVVMMLAVVTNVLFRLLGSKLGVLEIVESEVLYTMRCICSVGS